MKIHSSCPSGKIRSGAAALFCAVGALSAANAAITVDGVAKPSPYVCNSEGETVVVSGTESGKIVVAADCTVVLDGVTWTAASAKQNFIEAGVERKLRLALKGASTVTSKKEYVTAVCVCEDAQVDVTNLTADASLAITMSGKYCSAIGSSKLAQAPAGTINIWGGTLDLKSSGKGAGIGGYESAGGTVNIYGGAVAAEGGENGGAGIGGGFGGAGGVVNIYGGTVSATGGCSTSDHKGGAGIGGGSGGEGGVVNIYGGTVVATVNSYDKQYGGAAIGGGCGAAGGEVNIYGGDVTATGKGEGAGIGGGDKTGKGGVVRVYGGMVRATGSSHGAGIGGGSGGDSGEYYNYGGTVFATAGAKDAGSDETADIGKGHTHTTGASKSRNPFIIKGGSTFLAYGKYSGVYGMGVASNGTEEVHLVTVAGLDANTKCEFAGLPDYGQADIYSDDKGNVYLWLPDGEYSFTDSSWAYTVDVSGADAQTTRSPRQTPSGASAIKVTVRTKDDDGRVLLSSEKGEVSCTLFSLADGELRFRADLEDGVDFASWVEATSKDGKFKLLKAYELADLNDPDNRIILPVSAKALDSAENLLSVAYEFTGDLEEREKMFFGLLVED